MSHTEGDGWERALPHLAGSSHTSSLQPGVVLIMSLSWLHPQGTKGEPGDKGSTGLLGARGLTGPKVSPAPGTDPKPPVTHICLMGVL